VYNSIKDIKYLRAFLKMDHFRTLYGVKILFVSFYITILNFQQ